MMFSISFVVFHDGFVSLAVFFFLPFFRINIIVQSRDDKRVWPEVHTPPLSLLLLYNSMWCRLRARRTKTNYVYSPSGSLVNWELIYGYFQTNLKKEEKQREEKVTQRLKWNWIITKKFLIIVFGKHFCGERARSTVEWVMNSLKVVIIRFRGKLWHLENKYDSVGDSTNYTYVWRAFGQK